MSQIDHGIEQIGRRESLARFSSVAVLAAPLDGALSARPLSAQAWQRLHTATQHVVAALSTWRERARMRRQLLLLDDRLLRDIGISRLQARSEAEKPFWRV